MKLIEALEILRRQQPASDATFRASVVCGFTPLHIQTFLAAQLRLAIPDCQSEIQTGLYGDFWGNLDRIEEVDSDLVIILLEWSDFDARLGLRNLGSWAPAQLDDITKNVKRLASRFLDTIRKISLQTPVRICFPTLPLPPAAFSMLSEGSIFDLQLHACISSLRHEVARLANVKVVNPDALDRVSPVTARFDVKSELASGFPYKLPHASAIAELLGGLIVQRTPKKGLITDLDDTLWSGILGEIGAAGVSWDLEHHAHMHGAYQRFLHSLSEAGVLIAVASKNDPKFVDEVFDRSDLILPRKAIYPIEAHWSAKSASVRRILEMWNIGADAVVFIDDSPMELAEVKTLFPEIECILFPKGDPQAIFELFYRLRDLFGKSAITEEDSIRRDSIRRSYSLAKEQRSTSDASGMPEDFLAQAEAEITFNTLKDPLDPRALELINKTNQFNLNGKRHTDASWNSYMRQPETFLEVVSYKDKYGPLGKIAVLAGRQNGTIITLDYWVMSCRAFGRRIEQRSIQELFERWSTDEIIFDFQVTAKNGPIRDYLSRALGKIPSPKCRLSHSDFLKRGNSLERVFEAANG